MIYYMYKDTTGQWRWHLVAANNKKIAASGEGYNNEADCLAAINQVKASANAPVHKRP